MAQGRTDLSAEAATFVDSLHAPPPAIADAYARFADRPDATMMTHPDVGRLLATLVEATGGTRVVEIGTFVGISTLWMAGALAPGGHLDTLEVDPTHAEIAEGTLRRAGLLDQVTVHVGRAAGLLARLPEAAYDLLYIDADKPAYPEYLTAAKRLLRPGGILVADNVLLGGDMGTKDDARTRAMRAFCEAAVSGDGFTSTILTVGDGVLIGVRRA